MAVEQIRYVERKFGPSDEYHIRALNEEEHDQALGLILNDIYSTPKFIGLDFKSDEKSMESLESFIKEKLKTKFAFGCFKNETNELVGVDIMYVWRPNDHVGDYGPEYGESFCNYTKYLKHVEGRLRDHFADVFIEFLTSFGLFTLPKYQDSEIKKEMMAIRRDVAVRLGVKVNGAALFGERMITFADDLNYKVFEKITENDVNNTSVEFLKGADIFPIVIVGMMLFGEGGI
ncbi:uncharacterized protein LOC118280421 isoform X6 [Spodoptera frugiperda]|uniref:Uncharacterized protein LOC118280421 isoform X6 n=1 Tax=Spodoptera frugiperda TaxID=7108 RepID=A0A9R0E3U4_SPOFR|nr:uncharacterized protein LOC118280421 isoform X6 [Spodoptera frugiperda]